MTSPSNTEEGSRIVVKWAKKGGGRGGARGGRGDGKYLLCIVAIWEELIITIYLETNQRALPVALTLLISISPFKRQTETLKMRWDILPVIFTSIQRISQWLVPKTSAV